MRRQAATVAALAIGLFFPALPGVAQEKTIDFSRAGRDEVYRDLPGVVTPEDLNAAREPVVCVRKFAELPVGGRSRTGWQGVYSCTYGNMTIETNHPPSSSRDREIRGIGW
jgi:hypothetical protein